MLMALAMAGMSALQVAGGNQERSAAADIANITNEANAYASNLVRGARNDLASAKGRVARANQAENNSRILRAGGKAMEVAQINYRRARDSAIADSFENQIQFAEQAGQAAAAQAFSGITGGVVDMINGATALRKARIQQAQADKLKFSDYDAASRQADLQRATIQNLDTSSLIDNLDYNVDLAQTVHARRNLLGDALTVGKSFLSGYVGSGTAPAPANGFIGSGIQQSNAANNFIFRPSDNYGPSV